MLQVCQRNLTNGSSVSNTFVNFVNSESTIDNHMELTLYKTTCDNKTLKKTVYVFTDYEYTVTYYDVYTGSMRTITGLVSKIKGSATDVSSQYLTFKYIPEKTTTENNETSFNRGPGCGCFNKPNTDKYDSPEIIDISVGSITDISYVAGNPINPEKPKKGVEVVLLGISAEFVRAVCINLKLIDDCSEDAIRDIYMKVGGIYNVAYFDPAEKAIFELEGKLLSISETNNNVLNDTIVRRTKEQCGLNNSIYNCNCPTTDKDDYINGDNIEKEVLLTFDCSGDFSGHYHTMKLSTIRDCKVISEAEVNTNSGSSSNGCCNCNTDPIEMHSGNTKIILDPVTMEVKYSGGCTTFGTVQLQEIMDFYFGN